MHFFVKYRIFGRTKIKKGADPQTMPHRSLSRLAARAQASFVFHPVYLFPSGLDIRSLFFGPFVISHLNRLHAILILFRMFFLLAQKVLP